MNVSRDLDFVADADYYNETGLEDLDNDSYSDYYEFRPETSMAMVGYLMLKYVTPVVIAIGFLGNIVSVIVFVQTPLRQLSSSVYLAALAISDTAFLLQLFVAWLAYVGVYAFHTNGICQTGVYVSYVSSFLSVWLIMAFTVERFIAVCYPFRRHDMCTVRRAKIVVMTLSLFSMVAYSFGLWTSGIQDSTCVCLPKYEKLVKTLNNVDTVVTLIIPSLLIFVINLRIVCKITHFYKRQATMSATYQLTSRSSDAIKGTMTGKIADANNAKLNRYGNGARGDKGESGESSKDRTSVSGSASGSGASTKDRGSGSGSGSTTGNAGGSLKGRASRSHNNSGVVDCADRSDKCNGIGGCGTCHEDAIAAGCDKDDSKCTKYRASPRISVYNDASVSIRNRSQIRITKLLLVISSVFLVLNLPSHAIRIYDFFVQVLDVEGGYVPMVEDLQQYFTLMYYFNFSVNFFLYSLCGNNFRHALYRLGLKCRHKLQGMYARCVTRTSTEAAPRQHIEHIRMDMAEFKLS